MGNLKTVLWIVILGFIVLLFFQNQEVFLAKRTLRMDLFFDNYQSPEIPDILLFLCTFVVGYLISYFANLSSRFKFKKLIKQLNSTIAAQNKELTRLKSEISGLKTAAMEPERETEISPGVEPVEPPAEPEDNAESPQEPKADEAS